MSLMVDPLATELHQPLISMPDDPTKIYQPMISIPDDPTKIYQPLIRVPDLATNLYKQLVKLQDIANELLRPLLPVPDDATKLYNQLPFKLDEDIIWVTEELNKSGAFKTFIQIYGNDGRAGDKVTNRAATNTNMQFVLYSKEYNYMLGSYLTSDQAELVSMKYQTALPIPIVATNYWNYRIYFNKRHYCVPKKGLIFPVKWYIRGG